VSPLRDRKRRDTSGSAFRAGHPLGGRPRCSYARSHRPPGAHRSQPQAASQAGSSPSAGLAPAKLFTSAPAGALRTQKPAGWSR